MNVSSMSPNWATRLPGEQWLMLDSIPVVEAILVNYAAADGVTIVREPFPNETGLYARIRFANRITQDRIYISSSVTTEQDPQD